MSENASPPAPPVDVVVVGGGTGGLAAALVLGRSRRSVLVLDAGSPRNATAGHVHNYVGREGTPPAQLLADGRAELAPYDVRVEDVAVTAVGPWDRPGPGFVVSTDDGRAVLTRRLVVASGMTDVLPDLPGLAERWGRDVLHCPYCHGWEVRDRAVVVIGTSAMATHQAVLFSQLTGDVVLALTEQAPRPGEDDLERLSARGVRVVSDPPVAALVEDDALRGVRLASGAVLACDAVVVSPGFRPRSEFLAPLGLEAAPFEVGGEVLGTLLPAEPTGATAVPGVWAAGNVADPMAQVISSAASGLRVGALVNMDLIEEDTRTSVAAARAEHFEQPSWEQRYAGADAVWSGRVNPQLEAEVAWVAPGRALDVGSGEGADAIWLAGRGWQVTGLDFSTVALARAAEHADAAGLGGRVEWRHADVRVFDAGTDRWDLVTSQYMHQPDGGMLDVTRRLAAAVAPGGTLLVVGHHADDLATGARHGRVGFLFTPEDLLPALDPGTWEIEVAEMRPRTAVLHDGEPVHVKDNVLRARRRA